MNLYIMSRSKAKGYSYSPKGSTAFISINNPDDRPVHLRNHPDVKAVCSLSFDDILREEVNFIAMSKQDAIKIKEFVDIWWNQVDNFVVHCYAGISRSAGCMSAICRAKGVDDTWIWTDGRYSPNTLVARLILSEYGIIDDNYEELWNELLKEEIPFNLSPFDFLI